MITNLIPYIGWIGTIILLISYGTLLTKWKKWFVPIGCLSALLLTDYAILLKDYPFTVVNGVILTILLTKLLREYYID